MSSNEIAELRRGLDDLREEVHAMRGTLGIIHTNVVNMAGKTYVPGPPRRSLWHRIGSLFGLI